MQSRLRETVPHTAPATASECTDHRDTCSCLKLATWLLATAAWFRSAPLPVPGSMPKKSRKSLSKRVKLKDKFKIARKAKEHHKKQRKEAKKKEKKKPSVLKDPGIPANYPYREQVIKELQFEHQRIVAQRAEKRKAASERQKVRALMLCGHCTRRRWQ